MDTTRSEPSAVIGAAFAAFAVGLAFEMAAELLATLLTSFRLGAIFAAAVQAMPNTMRRESARGELFEK